MGRPQWSIEASGDLAVRNTCSWSGKNLARLPPSQSAQLSRWPQRCSPSREYRGSYRPALREKTIPATDNLSGPLFISLAGLDGEKERGLAGMLALGCSLLPAERAA